MARQPRRYGLPLPVARKAAHQADPVRAERHLDRGTRTAGPKRYRRRIYTTPDNVTHITPRDPDGEPDPRQPWEIKLSPWLYRAIVRQRDLLAVHPDYFQLTGGIERWLYRLARKTVPEKMKPPEFRFRLETRSKPRD